VIANPRLVSGWHHLVGIIGTPVNVVTCTGMRLYHERYWRP